MTEVILCLSAIYSGRPLPPRKKVKHKEEESTEKVEEEDGGERVGTFRTDGQGISEKKKNKKEKKPSAVSCSSCGFL